MRRTSRYVAMTNDERNAADAVPAQAGIGVFQQPVRFLQAVSKIRRDALPHQLKSA